LKQGRSAGLTSRDGSPVGEEAESETVLGAVCSGCGEGVGAGRRKRGGRGSDQTAMGGRGGQGRKGEKWWEG